MVRYRILVAGRLDFVSIRLNTKYYVTLPIEYS